MKEHKNFKITLPGEQCNIEPLDNWSEQERWVWKNLCEGKIADLDRAISDGLWFDSERPDHYPQKRVLTTNFIKTINFYEPFCSSIPYEGVRIKGARFEEPINLNNAHLINEIQFINCVFIVYVDMLRLKADSLIVFDDCEFNDELNMDELMTDASIFIRNCRFRKNLVLKGCRINGQLDLSGSVFEKLIRMSSVTVGKSLFMGLGEYNCVDLKGSTINEHFEIRGSLFKGSLDLSAICVSGHVKMNPSSRKISEFQEVNLTGARIEQGVDLGGSIFKKKLTMDSMFIGGNLFMNQFKDNIQSTKPILFTPEFYHAYVVGSKIIGCFEMNGAKFAKLEIDGTNIDGDVYMDGVQITERTTTYLTYCEIGRSLDIIGGAFYILNLSATKIHKDFVLGEKSWVDNSMRVYRNPVWHIDSQLILHNTEVGAIQDTCNSWPKKVDLEGFKYSQLGGFGLNNKDRMENRSIDWFKSWLGDGTYSFVPYKFLERTLPNIKREIFVKGYAERYTPQTYKQIANVLITMGYKEKAYDILISGKKREQKEESSLFKKVILFLEQIVIGYGYKIEYSFYASLILLLFGALIYSTTLLSFNPSDLPKVIFFSLANLLPFVELSNNYSPDNLDGAIKYYFYLQRIIEYILLIFIGAGFTGITKK